MSPILPEPLIREQSINQAALDNVFKAISTVFKAPLIMLSENLGQVISVSSNNYCS